MTDRLLKISVQNSALEPAFIAGTQLTWPTGGTFPGMYVRQEQLIDQLNPFFVWLGAGPNPDSGTFIGDDNQVQVWSVGAYPDYTQTRFSGSQTITTILVTLGSDSHNLENSYHKEDFAGSQLFFKIVGNRCRVPFSTTQLTVTPTSSTNANAPALARSVPIRSASFINLNQLAFIDFAYTTNANLGLLNPSDTTQTLTTSGMLGEDINWSPDGSQIAFIKSDAFVDQSGNTAYSPNIYRDC